MYLFVPSFLVFIPPFQYNNLLNVTHDAFNPMLNSLLVQVSPTFLPDLYGFNS